jgi:hypothetical protein
VGAAWSSTTVMVKARVSFTDQTFWPDFQQITSALRTQIDQTTDRILAEVFDGDTSDAVEVSTPPLLSAGTARDKA